jgi:toxin HigB-1
MIERRSRASSATILASSLKPGNRHASGVATRKLTQLEAAATLEFLRSPPGNRLEALKGDRQGQDSIRVNDQWRICFRWTAAGPEDAEIVDYH